MTQVRILVPRAEDEELYNSSCHTYSQVTADIEPWTLLEKRRLHCFLLWAILDLKMSIQTHRQRYGGTFLRQFLTTENAKGGSNYGMTSKSRD